MDENRNNFNRETGSNNQFDFGLPKEKSTQQPRENKEYFVDRSEKVRNFIANMQSVEIDDMVEIVDNDKPEHKGEVYFSTAPIKRNTSGKKAPQQVSPRKGNEKKRKKARTSSGLMTAILLLFIGGATVFFSIVGINCIGDILAINRSKQEVTVTVPENTDVETMIDLLEKEGLIKNKRFCNFFAKFRHMDTSEYLSGVYYMNANMGLERMLNLAKVAPVDVETVEMTIPEGYSLYQIFQRLESYDICEAQLLFDTLEEINFEYDFVKDIKATDGEYQKFESYFFPDKYEFYEGEKPTSIIKKFFDNYEKKWTDEYSEKARQLGMSRDEIMIIASIIQKEATDSEQMNDISAVIHNRLKNSVSYPNLECDSTLEYVNTSINPAIGSRLAQEYTKYYDTFSCRGLPAGAICNPGTAAIEAALNPSETSYYYFTHDNSGEIYLASTFAEYEQKNQEVLIANGAR